MAIYVFSAVPLTLGGAVSYSHTGISVYIMTLIKWKSVAQRQYRAKSLSCGLITLTQCNTDWMSEIHCILN